MPKNRYLDRRSGRDYRRGVAGSGRDRAMMDSERQARYDAKREEIARHRVYMHNLQMQMQPYRRLRQEDGTEYEYQSAFELPHEDYASRGSNQYQMKYDRMDYARGQGNSNSNRRDYEPYGESYYYPPLAPQDYARGRRDYGYDMDYDYARGGRGRDRGYDSKGSEEDWKKDLEKFSEKLKKKDRFKVKKEDIINQAKQMGVKFDEYTEEEFYVVYLMMVSDYKSVANDFRSYLILAKEWLEDDDIEVSPSEKLCIYYYEIVKGEGMDD